MTHAASDAQPETAPAELPQITIGRGPTLGHAALGIARMAIIVAACGPLVSWATWSVASNVAA